MRLTKKVVALAVVVVLGLSLILVPVVNRVSPTQAAIGWRPGGEVTLSNERYVVDSWVIRDADEADPQKRYKMWYTHGKPDPALHPIDIINEIKTLDLDAIITDIVNQDLDALLDDLSNLSSTNIDTIIGLLDDIGIVIGYATSPDGKTWTVRKSQALGDSSSGAWNSVGAPCVIWDATDGEYKMWYTRLVTNLKANLQSILTGLGGNDTQRKTAILNFLSGTNTVIGYATSSNGADWIVEDSNVLAGNGNTSNSVTAPSVIKDADEADPQKRYKMWFTQGRTDSRESDIDPLLADITAGDFGIADAFGILAGNRTVIGYATSPDGINWTPPGPAVLAGGGGPLDSVGDASVIKNSATDYEMWYTRTQTNLNQAKLQTIANEIKTLDPLALFNTLRDEGLAAFIIDLAALDISTLKSLLSGNSVVIGYASSADGINWTPQTTPDLAGGGSPWSSVAAPTVVKTGSTYEMWYTEGIADLDLQNLTPLVNLLLGQDLPIGYAYYVPYVPPPEEEVTPEELEEMPPEEAAEVIEEMTAEEAADILEEVSTEVAADILEEVNTEAAADILEEVTTETATAIIEEVATDTLNDLVGEMSEESLTDILPEVSVDTLNSIDVETLFEALPDAPTEQLTSEEPPVPPAGLTDPIVRYTTPEGAQYVAVRTEAGKWVVVMGTPTPVEKLMIKTNKALTDVETTLEVSDELPEDVTVALSVEQIVLKYLDISFVNATPEDIDLGHMTFKVEKEWLEENSIHKWSVALSYYDSELEQWITLPTKKVDEDDTYVYYTVTITHHSKYAISGSQTLPARSFEVVNLIINPDDAEPSEDITISGNVTNLSGTAGTFAVTLWLDNTVEAGKNVSLEVGETKMVSFTVTQDTEGTYEVRFDRLFGSFSITKAPPPPAPAAFTASELTITPAVVGIGETVTISALVTNTGDLTGSYEVTLEIDNVVIDTEEVTLAGGASQTVTFTTSKDVTGTYSISVNDLSGTFTVKVAPAPAAFATSNLAISLAEVDVGDSVTISVRVANTGDLEGTYELTLKIDGVEVETKEVTLAGGASQTVTFTTSKDVTGTYSVSVNGLTGTFTVKAPPPKAFNWWLVIGPVIGVLVIGIVVWWIIRRRRL